MIWDDYGNIVSQKLTRVAHCFQLEKLHGGVAKGEIGQARWTLPEDGWKGGRSEHSEAKRSWKLEAKPGRHWLSGWWFDCHFLFSHILGIIVPIDFHIFQRGGPTTNQLFYWVVVSHQSWKLGTKPSTGPPGMWIASFLGDILRGSCSRHPQMGDDSPQLKWAETITITGISQSKMAIWCHIVVNMAILITIMYKTLYNIIKH